MAINEEVLAQLKEKLQSEKNRVEEELNRIGKPTQAEGDYETSFNNIGTDEDENATEVEEYTDNLALEKNLESQLKDIMDALLKIENGSYGYCENCNEEIPVERLMVYPAARMCLNCK